MAATRLAPAVGAARGTAVRGTADRAVPVRLRLIELHTGTVLGIAGEEEVVAIQAPDITGDFVRRHAGPCEWRLVEGRHEVVRDGRVLQTFDRKKGPAVRRLEEMLLAAGRTVRCAIVAPVQDPIAVGPKPSPSPTKDRPMPPTPSPPSGHGHAGRPGGVDAAPPEAGGERGGATALRMRREVLDARPRVRSLAAAMLKRYADTIVAGEDPPAVEAILTAPATPQAWATVAAITQAWAEYEAAGGQSFDSFASMAETIVQQRSFGNRNALANRLEIRRGAQGWGIYPRDARLRWYDEYGLPEVAFDGGIRDQGWRSFQPPPRLITITIDRDSLLTRVHDYMRQATTDEAVAAYNAAAGYVRVGRLAAGRVFAPDWKLSAEVSRRLGEQSEAIAVMMALTALGEGLSRMADPRAKAAGGIIRGALKGARIVLGVRLTAAMTRNLVFAGEELARVVHDEGKPLDEVSERHLSNAVMRLREVLAELATIAATAAIAKGVTKALPPGPPPMQAAPGVVGSRGTATGSPPAAAAATGGPPLATPILMSAQPEGPPRSGQEIDWRQLERELRQMPAPKPTPKQFFARFRPLRTALRDLRAHLDALRKQGLQPPLKLDESKLSQRLEDYIYNSPLRSEWLREIVPILERKETLLRQLRVQPSTSRAAHELRAKIARIDAELAEWETFAAGKRGEKLVGDLVPDEWGVRLDGPSALVGDPTLAWTSRLHNFKTRVTVQVLRDVLGTEDVLGYDWRSPLQQRVFRPLPASSGAGPTDASPKGQ
jgi:hypothetical protein